MKWKDKECDFANGYRKRTHNFEKQVKVLKNETITMSCIGKCEREEKRI